jgi:regulator of protease activity HflC (stomatin/prohibitin superfamily)
VRHRRAEVGRIAERFTRKSIMFTFAALFTPIVVIFVALIVINASIRILRQYERGVMFTLGRFSGVRGPGLIFLWPWIQQIVRVDLRTVVMEVPGQDLISRDNVSVKVDAVLYFHVVDPEKAIIQVEQYSAATNMLAQTTLRSVLGQHELDEMLSKRATLNTDVQDILDARTKDWGIEVSAVEIRDIQLTDNMVKAIAKQAEAERDRRAKVIHADAEFQAAQTLTNAATILSSVPAAMQLRYLQTLTEVGGENNSTIIFPMPIDVIKPFLDLMSKNTAASSSTNGHKVPTLSGPV